MYIYLSMEHKIRIVFFSDNLLVAFFPYVTLDHKTSHTGQMNTESWINMISIDVWFVRIG